MFEKRQESSQFCIIKVASFMISNSDSPGVKLTRSIFIFYDLTFWLLSLNSCGTHISDRIRNDRIKINDRRTAAFNKAFLHFRYKRLLWCLAEIFVLFLKQVIKHLINFLRNIFYRPIPKTLKFFYLCSWGTVVTVVATVEVVVVIIELDVDNLVFERFKIEILLPR